ncbi:MAG: hypothetical protein ACXADY_20755 [Candidatus Hodarchaeales archaeon]|jgi:hypothetical protein
MFQTHDFSSDDKQKKDDKDKDKDKIKAKAEEVGKDKTKPTMPLRDEIYEKYWKEMKSRIVVGEELKISQELLFSYFSRFRIPMRYEPVGYEHEFTKLFNTVYNEDAESNSSDPFFCPAFRTLSLSTKIALTGTLNLAYLQTRINLYNFTRNKSYLVKSGVIGFSALSGAAMPIQQTLVTPINSTYMDVEIVVGDPDSELGSDNHFTVLEVLGFFG